MYDRRTETREFVGESREEAVAEAVQFFGIPESELAIQQPDPVEIYGLGGRLVIVARPQNAPRPAPGGGGGGDGRRGEGRGDRDRGGRRDRNDRGDRGGRRERGGRPERGGRSDRGPRAERAEAPGSADRPDRLDHEEAPESDEPVEGSVGTPNGDLGETGAFVLGVVERMGLGPFSIREASEGDITSFQLTGAAARELGSGDGRAVDALQLLANQAEMRMNEEPRRIVVDAEGDPERRESFLTRLAERAARRARESRRSVALDAMNPKDRRIIHVALRDEEGVATMSVGSGRYRQVVVVPEGTPEYEEARQVSEEASASE